MALEEGEQPSDREVGICYFQLFIFVKKKDRWTAIEIALKYAWNVMVIY